VQLAQISQMKFFSKHTKSASGFMTLEIMIALSIISIVILASLNVTEKSVSLSRQAVYGAQASFLLEEGAEAVRILRDNDWANISSLTLGTTYYPTFSGGTWILSVTPNSFGEFTRSVVVSGVNRNDVTNDISLVGSLDEGTKLFTVSVTWAMGGVNKTETLQFYMMDIF